MLSVDRRSEGTGAKRRWRRRRWGVRFVMEHLPPLNPFPSLSAWAASFNHPLSSGPARTPPPHPTPPHRTEHPTKLTGFFFFQKWGRGWGGMWVGGWGAQNLSWGPQRAAKKEFISTQQQSTIDVLAEAVVKPVQGLDCFFYKQYRCCITKQALCWSLRFSGLVFVSTAPAAGDGGGWNAKYFWWNVIQRWEPNNCLAKKKYYLNSL